MPKLNETVKRWRERKVEAFALRMSGLTFKEVGDLLGVTKSWASLMVAHVDRFIERKIWRNERLLHQMSAEEWEHRQSPSPLWMEMPRLEPLPNLPRRKTGS